MTFARERAGLTKRALAEAVGISEQLMGEIESGWRSATPANLIKIAEVLKCPLVALEADRNNRKPLSVTSYTNRAVTNRADSAATHADAPHTLVGQQADILDRLLAVLRDHPAGASFHLLFAHSGVPVADDEILVQEINPDGVVELRPRKTTEVTLSDVLHDTQVIHLADEDFTRYAATPTASDHHNDDRRDSIAGHLYGI